MILSLDTNVMVDITNDKFGVRTKFDDAVKAGAEIVTASVAAHELHYGCLISPRPERHLARAEALLADLKIMDWSFEDAVAASEIRRTLRQTGTPIGVYDVLIAGQALNRGWTVVSSNLREFVRVRGLTVVDWRSVETA